tara:strand:+ start:234 stop:428 length:195 start_codon:yes stop_codon:yes gene_type:complete
MAYDIIYVPRIQDEVVVATFDTLEEANNHMEKIKSENPKAHNHHYIQERKETVWPGEDSGIELF